MHSNMLDPYRAEISQGCDTVSDQSELNDSKLFDHLEDSESAELNSFISGQLCTAVRFDNVKSKVKLEVDNDIKDDLVTNEDVYIKHEPEDLSVGNFNYGLNSFPHREYSPSFCEVSIKEEKIILDDAIKESCVSMDLVSDQTVTNVSKTPFKLYKCNANENKYVTENNSLSPIVNSQLTIQSYKCDTCQKILASQKSLVRHTKRHSNEKPHVCNVCNKSYIEKNALVSHQRIHTGERPFICDVCGRSYCQKNSLLFHKKFHSGTKLEKPFRCNACNKCFRSNSVFVLHVRTHTGEKPFKCDVCSKGFIKNSNLSAHKRSRTVERPFTCRICTKSFKYKTSIVCHSRIHSGEKPFKCNLCYKSFSHRSSLDSHKRTHN